MSFTNPQPSDFQVQFVRDFPYGTDANVSVLTSDIAYAMQMTNMTINQGLFPDQASYSLAYNLLSAHFLVLNLRASSQGLNGQYNWMQNSKGVGAVNEAFTIPQRIIDNPDFAQYFKTNYGAQYMQLVWPLLSGPYMAVCGRSHP